MLRVILVAAALTVATAALTTNPAGDAVASVQGLITRLLGPAVLSNFTLEVIPATPGAGGFAYDTFEYEATGTGSVTLRGNSGVSLASALHWYLKYVCNMSVSWGVNGSGNQLLLPSLFPASAPTRSVRATKWSYYMNVCTVSYSAAFWDFARWQQEIDWMALHGVNLPLSFTGQEYVWQALYTSIGLTQAELDAYFSGPAFFAWQRMGNIQGWAGPLAADFINGQYALQLQILNATRAYGMMNVLPGFSGHVPQALTRVYPNANVTHSASWNGFNSTYSGDMLLAPTDPLFGTLGTAFYKILAQTYGTDHFYNADTFNEMNPSSHDASYLAATNKAVYTAMLNADADAVFVMQGWCFLSSWWGPADVQAYLSGVPDDAMLILDLDTAEVPIWQRYDSYYGKPFAWCMLHNFGGRRGLYGNLAEIANGPLGALATPNVTMVATGMTPEAIENNPIIYELMTEMAWRTVAPDVPSWVQQYAVRRYGSVSPSASAAWALLLNATYLQAGIDTAIFELSPAVGSTMTRNANATAETEAWRLLAAAGVNGELDSSVGPYEYDLTDLGRQVLANQFADIHLLFEQAFQQYQFFAVNSSARVVSTSTALLGLLKDIDTLLGADVNFLLGNWLQSALSFAQSPQDATLLQFNARNQITLWGPNGEINDYAAKHWQGLVGDYYYSRWNILFSYLISSVEAGTPTQWDAIASSLLAYEQSWNAATNEYPTTPVGGVLNTALAMQRKYATVPSVSAYTKYSNTDAPCGDCDMAQAWSNDVAQLMAVCSADPGCTGFVSTGFLKNNTDNRVPYTGADLYVKNAGA